MGGPRAQGKAVTGRWKSGYWSLEKRLLVVGKAVTGRWKSGYWSLEKRLLVIGKRLQKCQQRTGEGEREAGVHAQGDGPGLPPPTNVWQTCA